MPQPIKLQMGFDLLRDRTVIRLAEDPYTVLFEATEQWVDATDGADMLAVYTTFNDYEVELVKAATLDDVYDALIREFFGYYTGDPNVIDQDILLAVPHQEFRDWLKSLSYADSRDYTSYEAEAQYAVWADQYGGSDDEELHFNADDLLEMGLHSDTPDDDDDGDPCPHCGKDWVDCECEL